MSKKNYLWPLLTMGSLAAGIVLGGFFSKNGLPFSVKEDRGRVKLNKLIDLIEQEYVDNVNTDSIIDMTVNNILAQLDPHSIYISKSEFDEVQNVMKGSFVGIGINYYMLNDTLAVVKPLPGGPSDKAGLKAGDRILYAEKVQLFDQKLSNDSIVNLLKGSNGSKALLKVYRKSTNKTFNVEIIRGEVPLKSVDTAIKIDEKTGYIKINRFAETTYPEFKTGLESLLSQGIEELVLDLRENGGGYMEPAIQIADDFLKTNEVIVKTVNKKGNVKVTKASSKGLFTDKKLYILINENSASASEIIAGAIQDNDRGIIVGRRSYGKGLVQREMYLGDGSAVRLTTARYYTPSGRSIQKPYTNGLDEYNSDLSNRFKSGELYSKDSIHLADSLKFKTTGGRIVFGGGGIVPDVFVPLKNKHGEDAIQLLMKTSLVSYYVFEEIEKERAALEQLTATELSEKIYNDPKYFNDLKAHLKASGLTFNLDRHKKNIIFYLVAEYVHQLYDDNAYYHWIIQQDPMIVKIESM
ncbi:carboxyl-terminal processing protease [Paenimyroides aquimaris]|uniref:Carboxyl-terminal processing protease n=1 Tax=Paenimyroides marinum TaxID=1159016 RepID=A0A1H6LS36_9FLAO|nr:S41 family peptidase [Paenimyroides aquimaris]SEH87812.1 carboxyl-terminal processing protease [Paenimyroides aquimaris]